MEVSRLKPTKANEHIQPISVIHGLSRQRCRVSSRSRPTRDRFGVPPSVLRRSPPFSQRRATESDGALSLVDAASRFAPSEPMVWFVAMDDVDRLRTVARDAPHSACQAAMLGKQ